MPETYTKMGAGIIGASLGQVAVTGAFGIHAYVGLGIGGGLLLLGIAWGAIEAGLTAKEQHPAKAVFWALWDHVKIVPESLLVGFLIGVIIGAIQIAINKLVVEHHSVPKSHVTLEEAKDFANTYSQQNGLPDPTTVTMEGRNIVVTWTGSDLTTNSFYTAHANKFINPLIHPEVGKITATFTPESPFGPLTQVHVVGTPDNWGLGWNEKFAYPQMNVSSPLVPTSALPPSGPVLTTYDTQGNK
jgi:hypothetical protein